ncbi:YjiH family protein [Microbacterium sp. APC 3898]|uniref:YjiH family protein n=1 Tax=Planococcus notacanthi TaxID=3035188 RepID=A0ABT7ZMR1_9BACL|nr:MULTISPECIES: YjiH family protein [Terrabacteria group]MDN3428436.1 YjiH family protein [Planococcus sp. APC 4016]MDN3498857.1 YjiH family protein [Microbacterium sp. APC 3898]
MTMLQTKKKTIEPADTWKFLIPSIIGALLFLCPISYNGEVTIGVGILASFLLTAFGEVIPPFIVILLGFSAIASLTATALKPAFVRNSPFLRATFINGPFGLIVRVLAFAFGIMAYYEIGPEAISSRNTGGVVLYDLAPVLLTWFLFAGILLPLLVEFGLMEFVGALLNKFMRPVFTLPGRSSIDAMASWMGAAPVGVLVTMKQYDEGNYTQREAAVIATTFSIASVAFSLVVANVVGIGHLFLPFYLAVSVACLVAAIIMPRIPPLSRKPDDYYAPVGKQIDDYIPKGVPLAKWGFDEARRKAAGAASPKKLAQVGIETVLDIWLALIPLVMALGTVALMVAEYTPLFKIISYPLIPVLTLLGLPEAAEAAPTFLVGFADMFLPAVLGSGIESELTRFVLAGVSLTQIIYMSEIGILILRSNIPVKFWELAVIFILRTIITLPILVLFGHLFV